MFTLLLIYKTGSIGLQMETPRIKPAEKEISRVRKFDLDNDLHLS